MASPGAISNVSVFLAFLSPDLVEAILQGRQPVELTASRLTELDLPLEWIEQRKTRKLSRKRGRAKAKVLGNGTVTEATWTVSVPFRQQEAPCEAKAF